MLFIYLLYFISCPLAIISRLKEWNTEEHSGSNKIPRLGSTRFLQSYVFTQLTALCFLIQTAIPVEMSVCSSTNISVESHSQGLWVRNILPFC